MNERHIQLEESRESYSAPIYQVFSFETSDLLQTSGGEPTIANGFLGVASADKSTVDKDVDW